MSKQIRKANKDGMCEIRDQYIAAGHPWPTTARELAAWAVEERLWEPQRSQAVDLCAKIMGSALGTDMMTDSEGRHVKKMVCSREDVVGLNGEKRQQHMWDFLHSASRDHLLRSFRQQRQGAVADLVSLRTQMESANENNPALAHNKIPTDWWDLTDDVMAIQEESADE